MKGLTIFSFLLNLILCGVLAAVCFIGVSQIKRINGELESANITCIELYEQNQTLFKQNSALAQNEILLAEAAFTNKKMIEELARVMAHLHAEKVRWD
jgi:hypothetical protein